VSSLSRDPGPNFNVRRSGTGKGYRWQEEGSSQDEEKINEDKKKKKEEEERRG